MKRLLLIVDPQIDFITGSLPVPSAQDAMNALSEYIQKSNGEYVCKVVTLDWHPYNHCSFINNGGEWPIHCVQHTVGAAIYPALIAPLYTTQGEVHILTKGDTANQEEYSIFKNSTASIQMQNLIKKLDIEQIDVCGIAGDVCVLNTLKDGISNYTSTLFHILPQYTPSLDGGLKLNEYIQTLG